jgi:hypothetical protein
MRQLLWDLLRASTQVPAIPLQRRMRLARLVDARDTSADRLPWSAIFVKGYALTAREMDELRRAYVAFPRGRILQYPYSVANIAVERIWAGEETVFNLLVGHPAELAVAEIGARLRHAQTSTIERIPEFNRALHFSRLPGPARRLAIRLALDLGWKRARFFGTFGLSTVAAMGAELQNVIWPTATVLTYGIAAADGCVDVKLIFDHRVADAAVMARALVRLEDLLNGPVADEIYALSRLKVSGADGPTG